MSRLIERQLKEIASKSDLKDVRLSKNSALKKEKKFRIVIRKDGIKNASLSKMSKIKKG